MSSSDEAKGDLRSHDDEVTEKCVLNLLARMMHADADLMLFSVLCVCLAPAACFSENFSALEVAEGLPPVPRRSTTSQAAPPPHVRR